MATPERHRFESMELEKWKATRGFERRVQEAQAEVAAVCVFTSKFRSAVPLFLFISR
jgi:hypothetical protein